MELSDNHWPILWHQVFTIKKLRVFNSLWSNDAEDYQAVEKEVLKAYPLVPETYRQRFRGFRKKSEQSYMEFASNKKETRLRWICSKKAGDFDSLVDLIMAEDFLCTINLVIIAYLLDREFTAIEEAAEHAKIYALRHSSSKQTTSTTQVSNSKPFGCPHNRKNFLKYSFTR